MPPRSSRRRGLPDSRRREPSHRAGEPTATVQGSVPAEAAACKEVFSQLLERGGWSANYGPAGNRSGRGVVGSISVALAKKDSPQSGGSEGKDERKVKDSAGLAPARGGGAALV